MRRWSSSAIHRITLAIALSLAAALSPSLVSAENGWASEYGPGNGVAMHFCTWTYRHTHGCGMARITSLQTGRTVVVPIIDYCYCIVPGSSHPVRLVDLEYGVVAALGLSISQGMYPVSVTTTQASPPALLPNTATKG